MPVRPRADARADFRTRGEHIVAHQAKQRPKETANRIRKKADSVGRPAGSRPAGGKSPPGGLRAVSGTAAARPGAAAGDDAQITALALDPAPLNPAMEAYFKKCEEKLGFVPNVLKAYAFDMAKLEAFVAMYNDLMLAPSGLSKLEREMIAVAVSSQNRCYYCLTAHGAAVRSFFGDPVLGRS